MFYVYRNLYDHCEHGLQLRIIANMILELDLAVVASPCMDHCEHGHVTEYDHCEHGHIDTDHYEHDQRL